jgi:hypothetical protein
MINTPQDAVFNPYAAPTAPVSDTVTASLSEAPFFATGLLKLAVMSVATFGLYQIYWSYKNWKCASRLSEQDLNAPVRALFFPLTSYWLFRCIEESGRKFGADVSINAGFLAVALFLLSAIGRLPDPYWIVGLFSFVPFLGVQSAVNEINRRAAPDADPNRRFQWWNVLALIVGGILMAGVIAAVFMKDRGLT